MLFQIGAAIAGAGVIAAALQRWRGLSWSLVPFAGCVIVGVVLQGSLEVVSGPDGLVLLRVDERSIVPDD